MARQAIKTKVYDAQKFIEELKLARVRAGFGDLTPEELAKAKQAWEEAKILEVAEKAHYEKLLTQIPDATKLGALITKAGDAAKLDRLLKVFPEAELEKIFSQLSDTGRLVVMIDHVGAENGVKMIRQWMDKGKFQKMNEFMERLAGGTGKELAETAARLGGQLVEDVLVGGRELRHHAGFGFGKECVCHQGTVSGSFTAAQIQPLQLGQHIFVGSRVAGYVEREALDFSDS